MPAPRLSHNAPHVHGRPGAFIVVHRAAVCGPHLQGLPAVRVQLPSSKALPSRVGRSRVSLKPDPATMRLRSAPRLHPRRI